MERKLNPKHAKTLDKTINFLLSKYDLDSLTALIFCQEVGKNK
jgi:hypothetical protein